jgi:hypothetical protein
VFANITHIPSLDKILSNTLSRTLYRLQFVKLKAFSKFDNTTEALAAATALVESKLSKGAHQMRDSPNAYSSFIC